MPVKLSAEIVNTFVGLRSLVDSYLQVEVEGSDKKQQEVNINSEVRPFKDYDFILVAFFAY